MKRSSCKDEFPYEVINPLIPHMQIRLHLLKKNLKVLKIRVWRKAEGWWYSAAINQLWPLITGYVASLNKVVDK